MAPPRTGMIEPHRDHFDARVRLPDGKKSRRTCLDAGLTREQAQAEANQLQRDADAAHAAVGAAPAPRTRLDGPVLDAWAELWFADREARGLSSVGDDRGRWRKWISPLIGKRPIRSDAPRTITKGDIEDVVEHLDRAVAAGTISGKTASNVWVLLSKAMKDAVDAKTRSLRVRTDNPALGVRGPEPAPEPALQYLTPAEFLKLLSCEKVPLVFRRAVALAVFLLVRTSELVALTWDAVDLEAGVVTVHTAADKKRKGRKSTKTKKTRRVPIEAHLRPLLVELRREAGGAGRVLPIGAGKHLARGLRKYLRRAGIHRPDLYTTDATRRAIRFHDLRSSGITWHAIAGLDALKIMARSGHETYTTMQGYVRQAEVLAAAGTFGQVFPPLPLKELGVRIEAPRLRVEDGERAAALEAEAEAEAEAALGAMASPTATSSRRTSTAMSGRGRPRGEGPSRAIVPDRPNDWPKDHAKGFKKAGNAERETGFEPAGKTADLPGLDTIGDEGLGQSSPHVADRGEALAQPRAARAGAAEHLAAQLRALLAAGDQEGARVLLGALGGLLGGPNVSESGGPPAGVVDLAAERARRRFGG